MDLCDFLGIASPAFKDVSGKSRTSLISLISTHLQREELDEREDKGMAELLYLRDKINECQTVSEESPADQAQHIETGKSARKQSKSSKREKN